METIDDVIVFVEDNTDFRVLITKKERICEFLDFALGSINDDIDKQIIHYATSHHDQRLIQCEDLNSFCSMVKNAKYKRMDKSFYANIGRISTKLAKAKDILNRYMNEEEVLGEPLEFIR